MQSGWLTATISEEQFKFCHDNQLIQPVALPHLLLQPVAHEWLPEREPTIF